jgi:membrane protease YdiL (CAAX protease family)
MKKFILILVFLAAMLFFFSTLLNGIRLLYNYDWYFMEALALINQYAISLFILPLYWLHQYKNAGNQSSDGLSGKSRQFMFTLGFLCSEALANAIFFKLMHMPGGNQLFIITAVLGMIYVPFYTFRRYKLEY